MDQANYPIFVARITGTAAAIGGFVPHAWVEQRIDPDGRAYVDNELGLVGDISSTPYKNPAYDPNGGAFQAGSMVWLRLRGIISPDANDAGPVYDIIAASVGGGSSYIDVVTEVCLVASSGGGGGITPPP